MGTRPSDARLVALQCGRPPRSPFRVARECRWGYPMVITSPAVLEDGARFPTWAWLTCPRLVRDVSAAESAGAMAAWRERLASDETLHASVLSADVALRCARAAETAGDDPCADVGVAGQSTSDAVKCLHARVALALVGIDDPIGAEVLGRLGEACPSAECSALEGPTHA